MFTSRSSALLCTLLFLAVRPAAGGNLLVSGEFDQPVDIYDWAVTGTGVKASIDFDQLTDEQNCRDSGSARFVTKTMGTKLAEYTVCAGDVADGNMYAVGFGVLYPGGEGLGQLYWGVTWFDGPDCTGAWLNEMTFGPVGYAPRWQPIELWGSAPPRAASVRVNLGVTSLAETDPLTLNIDGVFVRPVAEIFADDFELGETCRWLVRN